MKRTRRPPTSAGAAVNARILPGENGSSPLAGRFAGELPADEVERRGEGGIGIERGRVENESIIGRHQRRRPTLAVARVTVFHVLQDEAVYSLGAAFLQLLEAPPRTGFEAGSDEELGVGVRADDRADVAAVEHGALRAARRMLREAALESEERLAHSGDGGDHGGGAGDPLLAQPGVGEVGGTNALRGGLRDLGVARIAAGFEGVKRGGAIKAAGVEMSQIEVVAEAPGERPFAGSGRSVDRDDHGGAILAPRPFISSTKPGKLVLIVSPSSMRTAA